LHAVIERLFPGLQTGKGRKQRWMNVNDSALERSKEFAFEHAHEPGEGKHIDVSFGKFRDKSALGIIVEFRPELSRLNEFSGQFSFTRSLENTGRFDIAQHDRNLRR